MLGPLDRGEPMFRQKIAQYHDPFLAKHHVALQVLPVDLSHQLPASAARCKDAIPVYRDDSFDLGLTVLQHLGNRRVLGTETYATCDVETNACVDPAAASAHCRADPARNEVRCQ